MTQEFLAELPSDWEWKRLDSLGKFIRGVTYKKENLLPKYQEDCITLLRANNIQNTLDLSELQYLPKNLVSEDKIIQNGDILFAMSSGSKHLVGKNILLSDLTDFTFGAFCSVFRITSTSISAKYLYGIFQSNLYRNRLSSLSQGSNINNLRASDIEILYIPLPPHDQQEIIVNKLDYLFIRINQSIQLHQENIQNLNELKASLLDKAFRGEL